MLRLICVAVLAALSSVAATAQARAEPRIALVVGEAAYLRALPNTANDAGLVAETLKSAGFEVLGGADLNGVELHRAVRDFLDRVEASGPGTAAVVYFAGHGLQLEGENFLVPVDARIERASDIPYDSVKVSDIVRSLANARAAVRMIVLDAARDYPLRAGEPPARGLAAMEAPEGFLLAFSAAPDATAPNATGPYGPYAIALVEAIRRPGLEPDEVFARAPQGA